MRVHHVSVTDSFSYATTGEKNSGTTCIRAVYQERQRSVQYQVVRQIDNRLASVKMDFFGTRAKDPGAWNGRAELAFCGKGRYNFSYIRDDELFTQVALMAKKPTDAEENPPPPHRGRMQAQGGGTEKSEPWAQATPPTKSEMLRMSYSLESQLTATELEDRVDPLRKLREFIERAAKAGGISAGGPPRSWYKRGSRDIRVDLEIIKGMACVPDPSP